MAGTAFTPKSWSRLPKNDVIGLKCLLSPNFSYTYRAQNIGLYRDVWIAAIASSTTSLATRTAAICVRFQGRRVRRVYVTMQITFLTRKSALIYRRGLRQRVASLTLNCNGDFAIRAYSLFKVLYLSNNMHYISNSCGGGLLVLTQQLSTCHRVTCDATHSGRDWKRSLRIQIKITWSTALYIFCILFWHVLDLVRTKTSTLN